MALNIAINALPALFCLKYVGKRFTLWSCFVIVLTSIFTDLVPSFPITEDPLLVAVFGGLINGVSIGICLYVRITSGGTDFIAIPLMERWNVSTWNYILAGNVVMLIIAGALFGWDSALYSIIFQFASTQVVRVMDPDSTQVTVLIVTGRESAGGVGTMRLNRRFGRSYSAGTYCRGMAVCGFFADGRDFCQNSGG